MLLEQMQNTSEKKLKEELKREKAHNLTLEKEKQDRLNLHISNFLFEVKKKLIDFEENAEIFATSCYKEQQVIYPLGMWERYFTSTTKKMFENFKSRTGISCCLRYKNLQEIESDGNSLYSIELVISWKTEKAV